MKNLIFIFSGLAIMLLSFAFINDEEAPISENSQVYKVEISDDVNKVLENSCIGCHNTDSKNTKGKNKLNFDELKDGSLAKGKFLGKLGGIKKALEEGTMPPEKFLDKYPDRALSDADTKLLLDWVNAQAKANMK
jgi:cytochrome c551/c552